MNKQEVIEKIKSEKILGGIDSYGLGYNEALNDALAIVEKLDEPEKPVLSKDEDEWLEKLKRKSWLTKYDLLYYITRQGFGHGFVFESFQDSEIKLEVPDAKSTKNDEIKERLVNAVLFGYEVEKEKLYTARLRLLNNDYNFLNRNREDDRILFSDGEEGHCYTTYFTQTELEELNVWENPAFEVKEVEE